MKMRGTNRQDQHCSRRRFAGCGTTGIGWIIWGLGKIFLTPRPMRIGLSGLMLWVGMAGVTLAAPASDNTQSTASSPSTRPIRNPFNVQGYMLEMAAKMNQAGVRDAVVGETGIQRSALTNGTTSSRGTWQPTTPPATIQPDITPAGNEQGQMADLR